MKSIYNRVYNNRHTDNQTHLLFLKEIKRYKEFFLKKNNEERLKKLKTI